MDLAGVLLAAWAGPALLAAGGPATPDAPVRLGLRETLAQVARTYPELAVVSAEREGALAQESLARWTRRSPRLTGSGLLGVVPGARGTIFDSPDDPRDLDDLGPFWRFRVEATMPVLTWGALGSAERAARKGVQMREARLEARRAFGQELAARAYLGHVAATQSLKLIEEVRGHLDALLERLDEGEGEPLDIYKARYYGFQLDRLEAEARRGLDEAAAGLRALVGREVLPRAEELPALQPDPAGVEVAVREALASNPELREADLAAEARELLARAAGRERWPALAVEGRFEYGRAPGRHRQDNPFVYDPFNVRTIAATLGMRWDLNLKQTDARVAREEAEAAALRARRDALRERLRVDLQRLHARMVEARTVYEAGRRALSTTANWLRVAEDNHGLGTASTREVVEAYAAYLQARTALVQAVHELDLATISWRLARGMPPLLPSEDP